MPSNSKSILSLSKTYLAQASCLTIISSKGQFKPMSVDLSILEFSWCTHPHHSPPLYCCLHHPLPLALVLEISLALLVSLWVKFQLLLTSHAPFSSPKLCLILILIPLIVSMIFSLWLRPLSHLSDPLRLLWYLWTLLLHFYHICLPILFLLHCTNFLCLPIVLLSGFHKQY